MSRKYRGHAMASSLALIMAMSATPSFAQDAAATAPADDADAGEIIVTATLRKESLQKVPLAVTAFDAESLNKSGVRDLKSFETVAPSFNTNSAQTESGGTVLRVRGVGTAGNNTGLESAVGVFLDGVYLSRPGVALGDLLDVDQVELLRGPQGTLFGRNTTAGAISIRTAKPNFNQFEGFVTATYGNYDLKNIQAGISAPLADGKAGVRLSGSWRERNGVITNAAGQDVNTRNRYALRGQFYYEPSADLSFRLIADYAKTDERCCDAIIVRDTSYVAGGFYGLTGLPANGGAPNTGRQAFADYRSSNSTAPMDRSEQWGVSGEFNVTLGDATLTSITAYRDYQANSQQEADMVSVNVYSTSNGGSTATASSALARTRIKTFTQELRLAGSTTDGNFDYLVGGFYSHENIDELQSYTLGSDHQAYISAPMLSAVPAAFLPLLGANPARNIFAGGVNSTGSYANNLFTQNARNLSVFTNNTFHVTDNLKINFGLRYSDDRKHGAFNQLSASSPACAAVLGQVVPAALAPLRPLAIGLTCLSFTTPVGMGPTAPVKFDRTFSDNDLIYTGKLLWSPADNINTYVSFTHGYKSGGFNLDPAAAIISANNPNGDPTLRSEKVNAYELGIKTKLLDNTLTANFALFRQDFTDFQVLEFTGSQFNTFNVSGARAQGFELELTARPAPNFTFTSATTYSDAKFNKDCDRGVFNSTTSLMCGQDLGDAPKWTIVTGIDWWHDIGGSFRFGFNGGARFESSKRASSQAIMPVAAGTGNITLAAAPGGGVNSFIVIPNSIQQANVKINLRASIGSQDGKWALEFWGNNVFDVRTTDLTFNVPLRGVATLGGVGAGGAGVARAAFVQEPATYGVTARMKF